MTRPLAWLLMAPHVPPNGSLGGMVRYVVELARGLAARDDVDLSVLTTSATRPFFAELLGRDDRVLTVPEVPTAARFLLERPGWGVAPYRRPFDVVQGAKHLLPVRHRGLGVLTVHDMVLVDRPLDFPPLKRRLLVQPYRASLRQADLLLCVSAATRDRLLAEDPGLADKAVVVPLALSGSLRSVVPRPVPQLSDRRFALVVGDPSPRKNLGTVVAAWEKVVARDPGAVLAVVGPAGWGTDERGARFDELVASGALVPLTSVGDDVLRWCYENARVVACPSLLEGFGLPSVEALHFGAPLVTSTDPALVEASGEAAVHLPPLDVDAWTATLAAAVAEGRPPAPTAVGRDWHAVADETVEAVRRAGRRA